MGWFKTFVGFNDYFSLQWRLSKFIGVRFNFNDKNKDKRWFKIMNLFIFLFFVLIQIIYVTIALLLIYLPDAPTSIRLKAVPRVLAGVDIVFKGGFFYHYSQKTMKIVEDLYEMFEIRCKKKENSYLKTNSRFINIYMKYLSVAGTMVKYFYSFYFHQSTF